MKELHVLLDFENVQPSLAALDKLAPGFTDVWLFHGPHQAKRAQAFAASHERVTLVPHSGKGKNALDFHLSFYLGYVAAKHPNAELVVVANDKGYDSMIDHTRLLGFIARRVGYKAPVAKKAAVAKPAAPAAAPVAAKKVAAKKAAPKPAAPTKAAVAMKASGSGTPLQASIVASARKIGVKVTVAKTKPAHVLPAKTLPAVRKTPAKKVAAPKLAKTPTPESRLLTRIANGLAKMGSKAPQKVKPFLRHVGALLGKDSTAEQIDAMVAELEAAGTVRVVGEEVVYGRQ